MNRDTMQEDIVLTLEEVCESCAVSAAEVKAYIEEGLVEVQGGDVAHWRFSQTSLIHIQRANRLERDLRLNPAGAVLAFELLEEIEKLKNRLKRFKDQ